MASTQPVPNNSSTTSTIPPESPMDTSQPPRPLSPFSKSRQQIQPSTSDQQAQSASSLPPAAIDLATKIFDLARAGSTDTLTAYLSAGLPANLTNSAGDTLLMLASYHGHASTVSALLEAGADSNVVNDRGQSPLAGAVFKGWDEVVKLLFEKGKADIYNGQPSAVDCARMFKREGYLEMFGVEKGSARPWEERREEEKQEGDNSST